MVSEVIGNITRIQLLRTHLYILMKNYTKRLYLQ